jgi:FkbM family methyltransferase
MERRDFLLGNLTGSVLGLGASLAADRTPPAAAPAPATRPPIPEGARVSFAQQGEDLIVAQILGTQLGIQKPSYVDIGAWDPVESNNTYLLYVMGGRGVLVEPNPAYAARLRAVRPRDTVLAVGIGTTAEDTTADYFVMANDQLNTFSKEQADTLAALNPKAVKEVVKMPLRNLNRVLAENFQSGPNFFSIDVEGLDLAILKTMDFERFRPEVFCVETMQMGTGRLRTETVDFLRDKGYVFRAGTFVNSVFIDDRKFKA